MLSRIASILAVAMANYDIKATSAFMPPATIQQANTKIVKAPSFALYYHPEQLPPYNSNTNNLMNNEYYDVDLDLDMATQDVSRAYERGVECANNFGMCDIDEVLDLSEGESARDVFIIYQSCERSFCYSGSGAVQCLDFSFAELTFIIF